MSLTTSDRESIIDKRFSENPIKNAVYSNKLFTRLIAKDIVFDGTVFKYSIFDSCYLRNCKFDQCDFTGCRFINCNFHGSSFVGANSTIHTLRKPSLIMTS